MTLPNFLIIGAQKSGTTWLLHMLRQHPAVYIPRSEVHYFDAESNFKKGIDWYERHFAAANGRPVVGEKTPAYLWVHDRGEQWVLRPGRERHLPDIPRRIHETLPQVKLIAVLRNPVERAISHLNHLVRYGRISPLHSLDSLLSNGGQYIVEQSGVLERGRYYQHIRAYQEYFDPAQMLILIFEEDVVQHPTVGLTRACEFLGIDSSFNFSPQREKPDTPHRPRLQMILEYYLPPVRLLTRAANRAWPSWNHSLSQPWKGYPSEAVIRELYELYARDNEQLFELLQRRPPSWQPPDVTVGLPVAAS